MGLHVRRGMHQRLPQGRRSRERHPALQAHRGHSDVAVTTVAARGAMSELASESTTSDPRRAARYRPPASRLWWVRRRSYLLFVLRELSSLFVAWFVVYLLLLISAVRGGNDSYREFLALGGQPW